MARQNAERYATSGRFTLKEVPGRENSAVSPGSSDVLECGPLTEGRPVPLGSPANATQGPYRNTTRCKVVRPSIVMRR